MIILESGIAFTSMGQILVWLAFIVTIIFGILLIFSVANCDEKKFVFNGTLFVLALVGLSLSIYFGSVQQYKLIVTDDSIPYNEFCKHWKVVSNDGMIITAERIDDFPKCENCRQEYENDFTVFCPNCGENIRWNG